MKNFIKENWFKIIIILIIIISLLFTFYWKALRPGYLSKICMEKVSEAMKDEYFDDSNEMKAHYDLLFEVCMQKRGYYK